MINGTEESRSRFNGMYWTVRTNFPVALIPSYYVQLSRILQKMIQTLLLTICQETIINRATVQMIVSAPIYWSNFDYRKRENRENESSLGLVFIARALIPITHPGL